MKTTYLLTAATALVAGTVMAQGAPVVSKDYKTAPAGVYTLDPHHASLTWSVSHMGFSHYTGRFDDLSGTLSLNPANPAASTVMISIPTDEVDTNNDALEEHLEGKDFFDSKQFPKAAFASTKLDLTGKTSGKLSGNLTLKGVTKPVVLDVTFNGYGQNFEKQPTLGFSAVGTIKRSDFGVSAYPGVVGEEVTLRIEAEFNQK